MIRRFLSLSQTERDAIYEQESNNTTAQQHCTDRLMLLSNDNALVRLQKHNTYHSTHAVLNTLSLLDLALEKKSTESFFFHVMFTSYINSSLE